MALEALHPLAAELVDLAHGRRAREGLAPIVDDAFAGMFPGCALADTAGMVEQLVADADPRLGLESMACTIAAEFIAAEFRR